MSKPGDITDWCWKYYKRDAKDGTESSNANALSIKWFKPNGEELYETTTWQQSYGGFKFRQSSKLLVEFKRTYDNLQKTRYYLPSASSSSIDSLNILDSGVYCKFLGNHTHVAITTFLSDYGLFFKKPGVSSIPISKNESPFTSAAQFYNCTMEYGNSQSTDVEPSTWYSTYATATIGAEGTWYQWIRAKTTNGSDVMYHPILLGTSVIVVANSPFSVNVNGEFKQVAKTFANVGGVWKEISEIRANVGGTWK